LLLKVCVLAKSATIQTGKPACIMALKGYLG
jgi:hypothetical protein